MRLPDPSPVLDKNRAPMGPEFLSSTGAGVWRKAPMAFADSSSVLDNFSLRFYKQQATCFTRPFSWSGSIFPLLKFTAEFSASVPVVYTKPSPMDPEIFCTPLALGRGSKCGGEFSLQQCPVSKRTLLRRACVAAGPPWCGCALYFSG